MTVIRHLNLFAVLWYNIYTYSIPIINDDTQFSITIKYIIFYVKLLNHHDVWLLLYTLLWLMIDDTRK